MTPAQRRLRGQIGAYAQKAAHDSRALTRAGRAAFLQRFVDEVNPDGDLPMEEVSRRAEFARKAYFAKLALASSKARARRRANGG